MALQNMFQQVLQQSMVKKNFLKLEFKWKTEKDFLNYYNDFF